MQLQAIQLDAQNGSTTSPKINIAPENDDLERWSSSSRGVFSGSMLIFRGVTAKIEIENFQVFYEDPNVTIVPF